MNEKSENNSNYKYKLNILISLCLILLIIIGVLIGFILYNKKLNDSTNDDINQFLDNISLDVTLNKTKEIDITINETNLDIDVFISRVNEDKLQYDFKDNLNNINYYLYFDEDTSNYVSNISTLDYSNNEVVKNYVDDLFKNYIENYLFYESIMKNFNTTNLNYSLVKTDQLLIKDASEQYLLINDYGLILEENLNGSFLIGSYKFAN